MISHHLLEPKARAKSPILNTHLYHLSTSMGVRLSTVSKLSKELLSITVLALLFHLSSDICQRQEPVLARVFQTKPSVVNVINGPRHSIDRKGRPFPIYRIIERLEHTIAIHQLKRYPIEACATRQGAIKKSIMRYGR